MARKTLSDAEKRERKNARNRKWRAENREKCKAYDKERRERKNARRRERYAKNPEKQKAYQAKWRAENREKRKAYNAKWRDENREKCKAYDVKYRAENPDYNLARELDVPQEHITNLKDKAHLCELSGEPFADHTDKHLDHIHGLTGLECVRGIIRSNYNMGLGLAFDDPDLLDLLAYYLEERGSYAGFEGDPKKTQHSDRKKREIVKSYGACEITGIPLQKIKGRFNLVYDHNHATGAFRGVIHGYINRALGLFGDDIGLLRKAAAYLRERGYNSTLSEHM